MYALVKDIPEVLDSEGNIVTAATKQITLVSGHTQFQDKNGIGYAPSYLRTWTVEEKQNHGIYDVAYGTKKDDRFYSNEPNTPVFEDDIVKISYTSTAKDLDDAENGVIGLKTLWLETIRSQAYSILKDTDWVVLRKIERDVDIPTDISAKRAAVITEQDRLETAIAAAADVDALKAIVESTDFSVKS